MRGDTMGATRIYLELGKKRVFACALVVSVIASTFILQASGKERANA